MNLSVSNFTPPLYICITEIYVFLQAIFDNLKNCIQILTLLILTIKISSMKLKRFIFALAAMLLSFGFTANAQNEAKIGDTEYATLAAALNAAAASTGNVTVEILDNVDLTDVAWTPVTVSAPGYPVVTVEGNNKTIKGLKDMLFAGTWAGKSGLTIRNLTIAESTIAHDVDDNAGNKGVGAFIGFPQASSVITLDNCHLVKSTVEGGHWTGGLIGYAAGYAGTDGPVFMNLTINNCSVKESTIVGKGSVGGIIGHGSGNAWTMVKIQGTEVSGNTITSTGSSVNKAGAVMGTIGAAGQAYTVNGVEKQGGALVAATVSGNTVKSNGTVITTIYGRQGTATGVLELNGGSYDNYPIEEGVAYAKAAEGFVVKKANDNTYSVVEAGLAGKGTEAEPYLIGSIDDLKFFCDKVNAGDNYSGKFVKLATNIDLNNEQWLSIGTESTPFMGNFDGGEYTISNLKIHETEAKEGKAYIGFFGYAKNATIKNVTIENVDINIACLDIDHSQGHIGAVAGSLEGTSTIENVTVKGDIKVYATQDANGASRVAVIAGGNSYGDVTMKNVLVDANEGSYLKANNNTGALAGQLQGKMVFENCSSNIDVTVNKFFAGGLIGIAAGDSKFTNCKTSGNVAVVAGREGRANDHYRVGGIAGGWADGKNNVCTLINCSYTGTISGVNADGSVAETLDYDGYVGRGYTLNGCAGSKVVIDSVEHVQAYNDVHGFYTVDGVYEVNTLAALKAVRDNVNTGADYYEGETIVLGADIDLTGENWVGIGSAYKDHGFMGNFDGKNFKIKNLTIDNPAIDSDGYVYAGLFGVTEGTDHNNQNTIKNLTIENVTINTTGHIVSAAIAYPHYTIVDNVKVCGDIAIKGGNYTAGALAYTRRCVNASNIMVSGNDGSYVKGNQVVGGVISDIQMNGGLTAVYSNFSAEGITVTGEKSVGGIAGIIATQTLNGATVKNVTLNSTDEFAGVVAGRLGGTSTISNVVSENVTGATAVIGATYDGAKAVEARIGDTYYATLDAALAAEGNEIELLAPITIAAGETKILDLNGKTISMNDASGAAASLIKNNGNLTIIDNSEAKSGKLSFKTTTASASNSYASNTISNYGILTIKSGHIENLSVGGGACYALDNYAGSTANIEGGKFTAVKTAVRIFNWTNGEEKLATINMNGGEIYSENGYGININSGNAPFVALNISGGTITTDYEDYKLAVYVVNNGTAENFTANVTGGTFNGIFALNGKTAQTMKKGAVAISGGSFEGVTCYDEPAYGFITGGTFDTNVTAYCAEGLIAKLNGDKYIIAEAAVSVPEEVVGDIIDGIINQEGNENLTEDEKAAIEEVVTETVNDIVENEAVNNFEPKVPAEVETFEIELTNVEVADEAAEEDEEDIIKVTTKITFKVEPKDENGEKISKTTDPITFRLPVPASWSGTVKVYHEDELMGTFEIEEENGSKYVEVTSSVFSAFSVEVVPTIAEMVIDHSSYSGGTFTNESDIYVNNLTYTRTLTAVDVWNALYVPFEILVTSDFLENYTVAYFNDVHSYDEDFNGEIDRMVMELIQVQEGQTLNANYPYLIKAKNEESKKINFAMENVTVYKATETTINCTSVFMKYELTGSYTTRTAGDLKEGGKYNVFAMSEGTWRNAESDEQTLNPFLLHLRLSSIDGSPVKVSEAALRSISISVIGEEPTADEAESSVENNFIYDVLGRRVMEPQKGVLYIMNGEKVIF